MGEISDIIEGKKYAEFIVLIMREISENKKYFKSIEDYENVLTRTYMDFLDTHKKLYPKNALNNEKLLESLKHFSETQEMIFFSIGFMMGFTGNKETLKSLKKLKARIRANLDENI